MILRQSVATEISFFMPDASDPWAGKTGLSSITVEYHKQGASSWTTLSSPTINEVGYGFYRLSVPAGMVDTLGFIEVRFTATGAKTQHYVYQVVSYNPYDGAGLGLSNLDATVSSRATPSDILLTPANKLATDASGRVTVGDYASGKSPAEQVLIAPANKLSTDTSGQVKVGDYASGKSPAEQVLVTPANKLATDTSGQVTVGEYASGKSPAEQVLITTANKLYTDTAGQVKVADYASGKSPAEQVLATPTNKLATDASGRVTVGSNADKTGYTLNTSEHDSIASAVWSYIAEGTYTMLKYMRLIASALFGKVSGADANAPVFRDIPDTKNRITMNVDEYGNRTSVTLNGD